MKSLTLALLAMTGLFAAAAASAQEDLARRSNCLNCHAVEAGGRRMQASSFTEIAGRFKGKPDAEALLVAGTMKSPHPPVRASDDDVKALAKWIMTLAK